METVITVALGYLSIGVSVIITAIMAEILLLRQRPDVAAHYAKNKSDDASKPDGWFWFKAVLAWPFVLVMWATAAYHKRTILEHIAIKAEENENRDATKEQLAKDLAADEKGSPIRYKWVEDETVNLMPDGQSAHAHLYICLYLNTQKDDFDPVSYPTHLVAQLGANHHAVWRASETLMDRDDDDMEMWPDYVFDSLESAQKFVEEDSEWHRLCHPKSVEARLFAETLVRMRRRFQRLSAEEEVRGRP